MTFTSRFHQIELTDDAIEITLLTLAGASSLGAKHRSLAWADLRSVSLVDPTALQNGRLVLGTSATRIDVHVPNTHMEPARALLAQIEERCPQAERTTSKLPLANEKLAARKEKMDQSSSDRRTTEEERRQESSPSFAEKLVQLDQKKQDNLALFAEKQAQLDQKIQENSALFAARKAQFDQKKQKNSASFAEKKAQFDQRKLDVKARQAERRQEISASFAQKRAQSESSRRPKQR